MAEYLHGAYGFISDAGTKVADEGDSAIVYVGTAPVHLAKSGKINEPVLVHNMAEAKKYFGYSEDWAAYTLCEAMYVHFELLGVGPIVLINTFDPSKCKNAQKTTASLTPANGKIVIESAVAWIDSLTVGTKVEGTDYTVAYDYKKGAVVISEKTSGSLGTAALSVSYETIDKTKFDDDDLVGSSDGEGNTKGLYAVEKVYQKTGKIPAYLCCPGFSTTKTVHDTMYAVSQKIGGHFDAWILTDLPATYQSAQLTLSGAAAAQEALGYNKPNETVSFPSVKGVDGRSYYLSVLRAAVMQSLLIANDGVPYYTASNNACEIIANLDLGTGTEGNVYSDQLINDKLCSHGIASAAFVGGHWALWGAHAADYEASAQTDVNVSETARMMLYYISNDFQHRRMADVDKPMTVNDVKAIASEEQARLDALVKIGALTYGEVTLEGAEDQMSDMMKGDFAFAFRVTTMPIAKSLTAKVYWTDAGFETYFSTLG